METEIYKRDDLFTVERWQDGHVQVFIGAHMIYEGPEEEEPEKIPCTLSPLLPVQAKQGLPTMESMEFKRSMPRHADSCKCNGKAYFEKEVNEKSNDPIVLGDIVELNVSPGHRYARLSGVRHDKKSPKFCFTKFQASDKDTAPTGETFWRTSLMGLSQYQGKPNA